jgi:hypothetical protein
MAGHAQVILYLLQMACGVFLAASPAPVVLRIGGGAYLIVAAVVQVYEIKREVEREEA